MGLAVVVATAFGNVDFAGAWPGAIGGVYRKHPDCWPEPVARRQGRGDLDTAIADCGAFFCADAAGSDRGNDGAICSVCDCVAVIPSV